MARSFTAGSTNYLEAASAPATATPVTLACWFYPLGIATLRGMVNLAPAAGTTDAGFVLSQNSAKVQARCTTTSVSVNTTTSFTANTWNHACAVFASSTSRSVYLNGGGKVSGSGSATPSGINRTAVGRISGAAPSNYFDGRIAEVAIWNVALSDPEIAVLAAGISPLGMQPAALIGYWPLWGIHSPEIDLTNGRTLTLNGTALANHAPVMPFTRTRISQGVPLLQFAASVSPIMQPWGILEPV